MNLLIALAYILLAVGLFICNPIISAIGCGVFLAEILIVVIQNIPYYSAISIVLNLLGVASLVMLLLACINRKNGKFFGIAAAAIRIVHLIILLVINSGNQYFATGRIILNYLLFAIGAALLGIASDSFEAKPHVAAVASPSTPPPIDTSDRIEKLTKLKALLDSGIITQEEFDAKKKELLGL
jgi:hypothetical protein